MSEVQESLFHALPRYALGVVCGLLALYCAVLLVIAFAAAITAPIWIWWCI